MAFEICSVNVRGLKGPSQISKCQAICHFFKSQPYNIICLLDTHLDEQTEDRLSKIWSGNCFFSHSTSSPYTGGIAVLTQNIDLQNFLFEPSQNGRYAFLTFTFRNTQFSLVACYAPAESSPKRSKFFVKLHRKMLNLNRNETNIILLGDFNCVEKPSLDKSSKLSHDTSHRTLQSLTSDFNLEDLWRTRHPNTVEFTYFADNNIAQSRIDRIYAPDSLNTCFSNINISPFVFSDHSLVSCKFLGKTSKPKSSSTWVFNQSLLDDSVFTDKVNAFWLDWQSRRTSFKSLAAWWDKGKEGLKKLSMRDSIHKARVRRKRLQSLYKRLRNAQNQGKASISAKLKSQILDEETKNAEKHFLSCKLEWVEQGEQCTKTFLSLHDKQQTSTFISEIHDEHNGVHRDTDSILNVFRDFYSTLYQDQYINPIDQDNFLGGLQMKKLSEVERESSAVELTREELRKALFELPNGKSPGSDGLPAEFYKFFWDLMGQDLYDVILSSFECGTLPLSQREAIIKCLPKKGDITKVKNWRPISLLNADYKIISKCLSLRLLKLLPSVISEEQTCSIKGRKISHNLAIFRDFVNLANSSNLDASLISLDQLKAFDRVSWTFLLKSMEKMNFSLKFIKWVKLLYTSISAKVKVNGQLSLRILIEQGVRQGCPLSALLYVLFIEALTVSVNANHNIKGIEVNGIEIKLSQYADDTSSLLIGDDSIVSLFETLELFERVSGAKINQSKTKALWLGSNIGRQDNPFDLDWSSSSIEILGLPFGNFSSLSDTLWDLKISSIRKSLKPWFKSNLTLKGKVVVIRQLTLPKIAYAASIYPPSKHHVSSLTRVIEDFIWSFKRPKIPTRILCLPVKRGGLGLPDISVYIKALTLVWVKQAFCSDSSHWLVFFFHFLNLFEGLNLYHGIFKISLKPRSITKAEIPPFFRFLLRAWLSFSQNQRPSNIDPANLKFEPIFCNPLIPYKGSPYEIPKWLTETSNCLRLVGDLFHDEDSPRPMNLNQLNNHHETNLDLSQFHTLRSTVPIQWHKTIVNIADNEPKSKLLVYTTKADKSKSAVCVSTLTCKSLYIELTLDSFEKACAKQAKLKTPFYTIWDQTLGPINWTKIFEFLYTNHIDRRTVDVQYRSIHNATSTRIFLLNAKLSDHRLCSRCLLEPETNIHIFATCSYNKNVWRKASDLIRILFPEIAKLSMPRAIFIGFADIPSCKKALYAIEDIRLAYFQAVYLQRNRSLFDHTNVNVDQIFLKSLQKLLEIRYHLAVKQQRLESFQHHAKLCIQNGNNFNIIDV